MSVQSLLARQKWAISAWFLVLLTLGAIAGLIFMATGSQGGQARPLLLLAIATALLFILLGRGLRWLIRLKQVFGAQGKSILSSNLSWLIGFALLVLLTSSTVYTQLDGLLQGFHQPGAVAAGIESATSALTTPGRRARRCSAGWSG